MARRLSLENYSLLDEMNQRGGVARICEDCHRHGGSRPLNMSDVEYEMTPLGRRFMLKRYDIASADVETIEPHRRATSSGSRPFWSRSPRLI